VTTPYGRHRQRTPVLPGLRGWLRKLGRRLRATTVADLWTAGERIAGAGRRVRLAWDIFWADNLRDEPDQDMPEGKVSEGVLPYNPFDRTLYLPKTKPWAPVDTDVIEAVTA